MFIFIGNELPDRIGEKPLINDAFDSRQFEVLRGSLTPGWSHIIVDETDIANQTRCQNIHNTLPQTDFRNLGKYYLRVATGTLWERYNWRPREQGEYIADDSRDIELVFGRSQERGDFQDNYQTALTLLSTIQTVPPANVAQLYVYTQQLSRITERILKLMAKMARPD